MEYSVTLLKSMKGKYDLLQSHAKKTMKKDLEKMSKQLDVLSEAYEKKYMYIQQLQAMIIHGCGAYRFFKENQVKKIHLYFDETDIELAELICLDFDSNYHADVTSVCISENEFQIDFGLKSFFGFMRNQPLHTAKLSSSDTIIIVKSQFDQKLNAKLSQVGNCIWLSALLIRMRNHFFFFQPLNELRRRVSDISVLTFNGAQFPDDSSRSLTSAETQILKNKILLRDIVNRLKQNDEKITTSFDEFSYASSKDLLELLTPPKTYFDKTGLLKTTDMHSTHMNVRNGIRDTLDVPKAPMFKVFLVGNCVEFGHGAPDNGTIQSHLQRYFNESGYHCEVVNCGAYLTARWRGYARIIENIPAKPGDIILLRTFVPEKELLGKGELFCNLADIFNQSHTHGEIVYDCNPHLTENGNKIMAKQLFQSICDNKLLENERQNPLEDIQKTTDISLNQSEFEELNHYLEELTPLRTKIGSIVMNCNPFTMGHRYLIEQSAKKVSRLYIFVVEEDQSYFPFVDRLNLVKQGTKDLDNVVVIPSGKFIISSLTFTDYFGKSELQEQEIDPSMDIELFAKYIAPKLNINIRFAGEEPLDKVTQQYNDTMQRILPQHGITFEVIPRKKSGGGRLFQQVVCVRFLIQIILMKSQQSFHHQH